MTSPPLTVVIADDSALYRQMLINVLRRIEGVELVGVATDGGDAVTRVLSLRPDVVTLDVRMPVMDGIAVLRELRKAGSTARVVMVSSLTGEHDPTTVEALMEGAFDHVLKPVGLDPHLARESLRQSLAEKFQTIRAVVHPGGAAAPPSHPAVIPAPAPPSSVADRAIQRPDLPYDAIAIGTSTGGPEALRQLIPRLPKGLPIPTFLVQHMPAMFTKTLAARLDEMSPLSVVEAADAMPAEPGRVHVAPGGRHLRVTRRADRVSCMIDDDAPRLGCRPSFDNLLESMMAIYGGRMVAVVLTGMGCDGLEGCRRLKAKGGLVIAQSHETCTVYGMPKAIVENRLADAVLPIEAIADTLTRVVTAAGQPRASEPRASERSSSTTTFAP